MNENDQKLCLKEISGEILDTGTTVNISTLSENWGFSMKTSAAVLEQWLETHGGGRTFLKQFLVRGLRDDGSMLLTIVPECDLEALTKKLSKCQHMLYSVKEGTEPSAVSISSFLDCKKKRLVVPCVERESQFVAEDSDVIPEKVVKQEKNATPPSQLTKPLSKVANGQANNNIASMFKNVKNEPKTPIKEQAASNIQKVSPKKKSPNKKDAKKNGSIGLFFSSKSQSQNEKSSPPITNNQKNDSKDSDKDNVGSTESEAVNGKRGSISNDQSENDEKTSPALSDNPPKRRKVEEKKKARSKGSRIMLMVDSDDDEEPTRKCSSDDEISEPVKSPTPEKKTNGCAKPALNGSKTVKGKKRRMVTKTYEDEDGFIRTVKESEEYSCSEPEEVEASPTEKKANGTIKAEAKKKVKASPPKTTKATRKPPTKQGSIMNFFSKK